MANPNIFNISSITGKTDGYDLTTIDTSLVSNVTNSNKIYKVNLIIASNNTTNDAYVTVEVFKNATSYYIAYKVTVPARSTMILISRDTSFYLEEGAQIKASSSVDNTLKCMISYDILE